MAKVTNKTNSGSGPGDSELIERYLQEQNPEYFTLLYRRYAGKVFAKCISMLGDEALAHDAVQDIFIKVFLNLSRFSAQSSFSTWLYSITYNFCIDLIRKKKKIPVLLADDVGRIGDEPEVDVPDSVLLEMKQDRLEKVLQEMPEGDRIILLMKYMDDMSIKDIADFFNKTESAIKMQIMRAKQKAQQIYDSLYATDPLVS
ncbi:MAG: RNA polymerase sigma factor [Bacteroidetes bacterium]|nr:MAG: RNA polymerase sigma factor [Bacteroidota bacterium]